MKIVNSLNWEFDFGKHLHQTIKEAIESNPSSSIMFLIDIKTKKTIKEYVQGTSSLISYLEWAEKEKILTVLPNIWVEIKIYDDLYTKIDKYENYSKDITLESYCDYLDKFNKINNKLLNEL